MNSFMANNPIGKLYERIRPHIPLIYLPILVSPIILLAPVWAKGEVLFWGTPYLQFVPWKELAWQTLRSGHLPIWNPMVGMGAPLLANYQSALIYPATWFLLLLSALGGVQWMAWGQIVFVIFHLVWAGTGLALLAKRLGFNALAQVVAGISFELCGYLVARAGFLSINAAAAWLPWVMLAGYNLAVSKTVFKIKNVIPLTLCMGMQLLAGHAQTTYYTILLLFPWMIFWGWRQAGWKKGLTACALLALAGFLAAAVTAVQLLPTLEYLLQSQRAGSVGYEYAMNYSFFPMRLLSLLAGNLFGSPAQGNYMLKADNYWEDAIYMGLLPLLLAVYAVARLITKADAGKPSPKFLEHEKPVVLFLLIAVILSFLLAFGKNLPLFPFLYQHIPTFDMFQAPARWTLWAEFGLALLAGIGAHAWQRPLKRALYWTNLGTAGGVAVIIGSILALIYLPGVATTLITAMALVGLLVLASGLLAHYAPSGTKVEPGKLWKWLVLALITLDLLLADWGLNPGAPLTLYQGSIDNTMIKSILQDHRLYINPVDENEIKFSRFFRFISFLPEENLINLNKVYLPNSGILSGISSANNFDPLLPARYSRWMDYLSTADISVKQTMLMLMDVAATESLDVTSPSGVSFEPVTDPERVRWSTCALSATTEEEAWNMMKTRLASSNRNGNQDTQPILLEGADIVVGPCDASTVAVVKITSQNPNQTVIQTQSSKAGWVVSADVWYPGWKVLVDGKGTDLLRANYLFRGAAVPAGEHVIEFVYRPYSVYVGFCISLLTLAGIIFVYNRGV